MERIPVQRVTCLSLIKIYFFFFQQIEANLYSLTAKMEVFPEDLFHGPISHGVIDLDYKLLKT